VITRLAQCLWIVLALGLVLLPVLWWSGIPGRAAVIITGVLAGLLCLVVLIRPFRRSDWEEFWEHLADWCSWW
jgi:hypothetical protein